MSARNTMKFQFFFIFIFLIFLFSCGQSTLGGQGTLPPNHILWDELVRAHVRASGEVDYRGFIREKDKLESYLEQLSKNAPDRNSWTEAEQLAYWINAYNAFTVKLIVDNYPVESIRDLGPKLKIPLIKDVWHYEFFEINGEPSSLDEIEHSILRKEFEEPRIHFAINCASVSCPPLYNRAFVPEKLEEQLEFVTRRFINDPSRNKISRDQVEISSIFSWFKGDFTKKGTLIDFLNQYSQIPISRNARVSHLDYDWSLNE